MISARHVRVLRSINLTRRFRRKLLLREVPVRGARFGYRGDRNVVHPSHRDYSGRDGQRLAGVGGVVDFIGGLILMRLMSASAIVQVDNSRRPHTALDRMTPDHVYFGP
jgi:hypothetical protein